MVYLSCSKISWNTTLSSLFLFVQCFASNGHETTLILSCKLHEEANHTWPLPLVANMSDFSFSFFFFVFVSFTYDHSMMPMNFLLENSFPLVLSNILNIV